MTNSGESEADTLSPGIIDRVEPFTTNIVNMGNNTWNVSEKGRTARRSQ